MHRYFNVRISTMMIDFLLKLKPLIRVKISEKEFFWLKTVFSFIGSRNAWFLGILFYVKKLYFVHSRFDGIFIHVLRVFVQFFIKKKLFTKIPWSLVMFVGGGLKLPTTAATTFILRKNVAIAGSLKVKENNFLRTWRLVEIINRFFDHFFGI